MKYRSTSLINAEINVLIGLSLGVKIGVVNHFLFLIFFSSYQIPSFGFNAFPGRKLFNYFTSFLTILFVVLNSLHAVVR